MALWCSGWSVGTMTPAGAALPRDGDSHTVSGPMGDSELGVPAPTCGRDCHTRCRPPPPPRQAGAHLYGCSPVCVRRCLVRFADRGKIFPQYLGWAVGRP